MNSLDELVRSLLRENGRILNEIAPGLHVISEDRKCHGGKMFFRVSWDPECWRLGKKNPSRCYLELNFQWFDGSDEENLIGHLKNILEPLKEGLGFYPEPKYLQTETVAVTR